MPSVTLLGNLPFRFSLPCVFLALFYCFSRLLKVKTASLPFQTLDAKNDFSIPRAKAHPSPYHDYTGGKGPM